ncbi:hypothetical protein BpHYR1_053768 [Brachionus plicatilis]|uniref:Uncharacterized protein n=1 Tax=Brachionus plicatilis TaxID=10195 RepID=A0A3M7RPU1_BRAPC|nr:hypothetical protein BpHYR1_053768 [Brachionus plicatilis]
MRTQLSFGCIYLVIRYYLVKAGIKHHIVHQVTFFYQKWFFSCRRATVRLFDIQNCQVIITSSVEVSFWSPDRVHHPSSLDSLISMASFKKHWWPSMLKYLLSMASMFSNFMSLIRKEILSSSCDSVIKSRCSLASIYLLDAASPLFFKYCTVTVPWCHYFSVVTRLGVVLAVVEHAQLMNEGYLDVHLWWRFLDRLRVFCLVEVGILHAAIRTQNVAFDTKYVTANSDCRIEHLAVSTIANVGPVEILLA